MKCEPKKHKCKLFNILLLKDEPDMREKETHDHWDMMMQRAEDQGDGFDYDGPLTWA